MRFIFDKHRLGILFKGILVLILLYLLATSFIFTETSIDNEPVINKPKKEFKSRLRPQDESVLKENVEIYFENDDEKISPEDDSEHVNNKDVEEDDPDKIEDIGVDDTGDLKGIYTKKYLRTDMKEIDTEVLENVAPFTEKLHEHFKEQVLVYLRKRIFHFRTENTAEKPKELSSKTASTKFIIALSFRTKEEEVLHIITAVGKDLVKTADRLVNKMEKRLDKIKTKGGYEKLSFDGVVFDVFKSPAVPLSKGTTGSMDIRHVKKVTPGIKGLYCENKNKKLILLPEQLYAKTPGIIFEKHIENNYQVDECKIFVTKQYFVQNMVTNNSNKEANDGIFNVVRGHRMLPTEMEHYSSDYILEASKLVGNYLLNVVDENGRFIYVWDPIEYKGKIDNKKYNILRHVGSLYAMLELYEITKTSTLLNAVNRGISYLKNDFVKHDCAIVRNGKTNKGSCIVEKNSFKLGGMGLAVLMLAKYNTVLGDNTHVPLMFQLSEMILLMQNKDTGEFDFHKVSYPDFEKSEFVSGYYPGEAIFGLARLHSLIKEKPALLKLHPRYSSHNDAEMNEIKKDMDNNRWITGSKMAAKWLINIRDFSKKDNELDQDHWLLYGLNELYRVDHDKLFLYQINRIITVIMASQVKKGDVGEENIDNVGHLSSAAVVEGSIAAYKLYRDYNDYFEENDIEELKFTMEDLLDTIHDAATHQIYTQTREEMAMFFDRRIGSLIMGSFHKSVSGTEIRNDHCQHNLSAILNYYYVLKKMGL